MEKHGMSTVYVNFYGLFSVTEADRIEDAYRESLHGAVRNLAVGIIRTFRPTAKIPKTGVRLEPVIETQIDRCEPSSPRFARSSREIGDILEPLLATVRGHPQRAMLLAHFLWERTPRGEECDAASWQQALGDVYLELRDELSSIWNGLGDAERRAGDRRPAARALDRHRPPRARGHFSWPSWLRYCYSSLCDSHLQHW